MLRRQLCDRRIFLLCRHQGPFIRISTTHPQGADGEPWRAPPVSLHEHRTHYLGSRITTMVLFTSSTPSAQRAVSTAWSAVSCVGVEPLSHTIPSWASTLMFAMLPTCSAANLVFTAAVTGESLASSAERALSASEPPASASMGAAREAASHQTTFRVAFMGSPCPCHRAGVRRYAWSCSSSFCHSSLASP